MAGLASTCAAPRRMPDMAPTPTGRARRSLVPRIIASTTITARNDAAFRANAVDAPHAAITRPARNGPSARAALNCALLSVTAFSKVSRGTSSVTNDCQMGMLSPPASPATKASADNVSVVAEPLATRANRASAQIACTTCASTSSNRRGYRSARLPPTRPMSINGRYWKKPVMPTSPARPVSW